MNIDDLDVNPTVKSIRAIIGDELMIKLSTELGGRHIYIPSNPGENSPLSVSIGLDAATKIGQIYGGSFFDPPLGPGKRARIIEMHKNGDPISRIGNKIGMSMRNVRRIINANTEDNQLDFFAD